MKNINRYYDLVIQEAKRSPDETKIGAVLLRDGEVIAIGHNRLPKGVEVSDERLDNERKIDYILHAETGVISSCAREGIATNNTAMIVAGKCICSECAKVLINAGVKKIYCPPPDINSKWVESNRIALEVLKEANVEVVILDRLKGIEHGLTIASKYKA